jgi:hypothetical protein
VVGMRLAQPFNNAIAKRDALEGISSDRKVRAVLFELPNVRMKTVRFRSSRLISV